MAESVARPSDKARVHNTRQRILDAAQKMVEEAGDASRYFSPPTRTAIAARAGVHPQTVRKRFQDWSAICAALVERYRVTPGATAPENVRSWAREHFDREATGREITVPEEVEELRDRYAAISTGDNDIELTLTAKALVDKLAGGTGGLAAHAGEIIACARLAQDRLDIFTANGEALEAALVLADTAVQAHRHLAYGSGGRGNAASERTRSLKSAETAGAGDATARALRMVDQALYEPKHLQAIIQVKRWDVEVSARLGRKARVVLAQFHIARGEALIGRRPEDELSSLIKVVAGLRALQQAKPPDHAPIADVVVLVARLVGVCLAYPDLVENGELDTTRAELLKLFKTETFEYDTQQLMRDAQSLFKLVDEEPVEAPDLLRALRFWGPGDFLIARHLAAQAEMSDENIEGRFGTTLGPPDHVRILLLNRAHSCYKRVRDTSRVTGCAAQLAGMAAAEMVIAEHKITELGERSASLPAKPTGDETIAHLQRNINDLIHRAVLGESLVTRQVAQLISFFEPIRTFLMGADKHRL
ncbi:TetR/AcrR family transcriptional regulator [Nocardia fusca]|uniref:TetR/AcrR family transcriptional regulator n=1 Tax=Nocardia fusca TaxID=941183 RepID=UPI0037A42D6F